VRVRLPLFLAPSLRSRKAQPLHLPLDTVVSHLGVGAFDTALSGHGSIDSVQISSANTTSDVRSFQSSVVLEAKGKGFRVVMFTINSHV
jgi:hypothetical protein